METYKQLKKSMYSSHNKIEPLVEYKDGSFSFLGTQDEMARDELCRMAGVKKLSDIYKNKV